VLCHCACNDLLQCLSKRQTLEATARLRCCCCTGADPLPFGPSNPPSALIYQKPFPLSKCNKLGACTADEIDKANDLRFQSNSGDTFPKDFNIGYWRQLWAAQEAKHANPQAKPQLADW
jgi:hypothetical protein